MLARSLDQALDPTDQQPGAEPGRALGQDAGIGSGASGTGNVEMRPRHRTGKGPEEQRSGDPARVARRVLGVGDRESSSST